VGQIRTLGRGKDGFKMNGYLCEKCDKREVTNNIRGWDVCNECYIEMLQWDNPNYKSKRGAKMNDKGFTTVTIEEARGIISKTKNIKKIESRQNYYWSVFEIEIIYNDDTFKELTIKNPDNKDIAKMLNI
jgi:hypothetical protein